MHQNLEEVKHLHLSGPGHSLILLGLSSPWMSYSEGSHQSPSGGTSLAIRTNRITVCELTAVYVRVSDP